MNKYSIRSIPAAAAMAAALLIGAQVHAQTATTTPPGTTKSKDAVMPAPGNNATPARTTDATTSSMNAAQAGSTMTPGTTKSKDNVSPEPSGGMAKSADQRTADKMAKADKKAAKRGKKAKMMSKNNAPVDGVDTNKGGTK